MPLDQADRDRRNIQCRLKKLYRIIFLVFMASSLVASSGLPVAATKQYVTHGMPDTDVRTSLFLIVLVGSTRNYFSKNLPVDVFLCVCVWRFNHLQGPTQLFIVDAEVGR